MTLQERVAQVILSEMLKVTDYGLVLSDCEPAAEAIMQEMTRYQMEQATASVTLSQEEISMLLERD